MRVLRVLGVLVGLFLVVKLLTAPMIGVLLGWSLLVYVIVRAVPAIRADVSRLLGRLPNSGAAHSSWRF